MNTKTTLLTKYKDKYKVKVHTISREEYYKGIGFEMRCFPGTGLDLLKELEEQSSVDWELIDCFTDICFYITDEDLGEEIEILLPYACE